MNQKSTQAYIANTGVITAIGNNLEENFFSLSHSESGISFPSILKTIHQLPVGEIKLTNQQLASLINERYSKYNLPEQNLKHLPRTSLLSLLAVQEAWLPLAPKSKGLRIGFISANTVGGMDLTENFYEEFLQEMHGNLGELRNHECGSITEIVLDSLNLDCWSTTISTACSSSANSIMMAARMIQQNRYDVIIAGGADSLSRFTLNGFHSLMILDSEFCKPFDQNRKGLNLGEGAAYLVLANQKALDQFAIKATSMVSGFANANDAHHQTASSPEGIGNRLAMGLALQKAQITHQQIDYINLHGTGTENNDSSEGNAIDTLFDGHVPAASSTKSFTGHTLGAAGSVEAVFSHLSIVHQMAWPNLRFMEQMDHLKWSPITELKNLEINHVLSNSFGFGGNCTALILSKVD